jgi:hypothetical protein
MGDRASDHRFVAPLDGSRLAEEERQATEYLGRLTETLRSCNLSL